MKKRRPGNWLPEDTSHLAVYARSVHEKSKKSPKKLVPPIKEFRKLVRENPALKKGFKDMFREAAKLKRKTPLKEPEVKNFKTFLKLLNTIMTQAPQYTEFVEKGKEEPCGLIGFPINALLNWPMATPSGYAMFSNQLVNQQLKKILSFWSEYLQSEGSRDVLVEEDLDAVPKVIGWLSKTARKEMVEVACQGFKGKEKKACEKKEFHEIFRCDPSDRYYGFKSWDDFFTREFQPGVRPVASPKDDDVIANACESAPLKHVSGVKKSNRFWLKKQPYSLSDMMNFDPLSESFDGGTVYQAFLSALSYHRWHSPVSGVVKKAFVVNGSYYLENRHEGFMHHDAGKADSSAPNDSQAFLTAVATRAVIFIEADNPKIGLMCFIAVGMAEVSSCEITVSAGDKLKKGDPLGMFHFGGSTHCLIFRKETKLKFHLHGHKPGLNAENIPVRARIANVL